MSVQQPVQHWVPSLIVDLLAFGLSIRIGSSAGLWTLSVCTVFRMALGALFATTSSAINCNLYTRGFTGLQSGQHHGLFTEEADSRRLKVLALLTP
jgi:hypothetical protein